ncbi:MAG: hypothetical protein HY939_00785 [Gammaproteobacteria bacterium]|nr:hypothetical protein [Gammaproteobacteria bacterium]
MGIVIDRIKDNEHFEYKGDVHVTESIGKNAAVIIKDGSLVVDGNVGERADITMAASQSTVVVQSVSFYSSAVSVSSGGGAHCTLRVM